MAKQQPASNKLRLPWPSWVLIVVAYMTYGGFLHQRGMSNLGWTLSVILTLLLAIVTTIGWKLCRRFILLGFQSDLGYFLMALSLASMAVAAVTQFHLFASVMLLVAVSLLARVDMVIADFNNGLAFLIMSVLSCLGLGLSWVPHLLNGSVHLTIG
ncbi:MAG: hypothetical protein HC929_21605 [Leptolyngbyaceae cyanobacterium SM2_5_2]|nr:hypothetical protein [Leptolyngbyaceae cyanobacterium SM2_5_2]